MKKNILITVGIIIICVAITLIGLLYNNNIIINSSWIICAYLILIHIIQSYKEYKYYKLNIQLIPLNGSYLLPFIYPTTKYIVLHNSTAVGDLHHLKFNKSYIFIPVEDWTKQSEHPSINKSVQYIHKRYNKK